MVRHMLVACICDFCGKTVYCRANYNPFHDLYEDGLPDGWEFIDPGDNKLISHTGDHCPECLNSFAEYINRCCIHWMRYVRFRGNKVPDYADNDTIGETGLP